MPSQLGAELLSLLLHSHETPYKAGGNPRNGQHNDITDILRPHTLQDRVILYPLIAPQLNLEHEEHSSLTLQLKFVFNSS